MKKPKTVIDAEAWLIAKTAEVNAAKEALKRLDVEKAAASAAFRQAQTDADASQPQCRLVCVKRYSGKTEDISRVVILRRTPGGMLVVRYVGQSNGLEYKFKWSQHRSLYAQTYEQYSGQRPHRDDYMPNWPAEQRTHLMMYEDTTEGTPISPAFETPEELARWLVDNKASAFCSDTGSYEGWLRVAQGGWAPSMVVSAAGVVSGVDAL